MSRERLKGDWKRLKGKARQAWSELNDEDLDVLEGRRERGIGPGRRRRGTAKDGFEDWPARFADSDFAG